MEYDEWVRIGNISVLLCPACKNKPGLTVFIDKTTPGKCAGCGAKQMVSKESLINDALRIIRKLPHIDPDAYLPTFPDLKNDVDEWLDDYCKVDL